MLTRVAGHWPKLLRQGSPDAYTRRALINQHISWRRRTRKELPSAHPPERGHSHDATVDRPGEARILRLGHWLNATKAAVMAGASGMT
ncbi:hypothetical protein [Streptosporangium minutum]|uniref:hypothetical protein n=1 Tax=Streptosporangium minutum TaxID=569862 RepID=UPI001A996AB2|nr:hypothetical protein [Streptosporangium minutum]